MLDGLLKMKDCLSSIRNNDNLQVIYKYFRNKDFLPIFVKQIENLAENLRSISLLTDADNINDAFTIFRKYLETYFITMSLIVHPELVEQYMIHNGMIGLKACKKDLDKVRKFCENKPDNFLEYGYLEKYIDTNEDNFKYSSKSAAKVGGMLEFHRWYKMCNNFVHNNLTSVNVDKDKGKKTLNKALEETTTLLVSKIHDILKR